MIGYITSPRKEVAAICRITKGLHATPEGESIEFEKIEHIDTPVTYETIQSTTDLENCEPVKGNQGSLFKLTAEEFEIIRGLVEQAGADDDMPQPIPYSEQEALEKLFLSKRQFDDMLLALQYKKNVVLEGPPGAGKTFIAKHLAHAFIKFEDPRKVEMIQFHQSYTYEDFIQGFRPGQGYDKLAIQEGGAASREFLRVTYGQATDAERRRVRQNLEEYCGLDTLGMVQIVDQLKRLTARAIPSA